MRSKLSLLALPFFLLPLLPLTACYTISHEYGGSREVTPGTKLTDDAQSVGKVTARKKAHFLFWGLLPLNDAPAPELIEAAAVDKHGSDIAGVSHVEIHEEQDVIDVVATILTLGIFSMVTVETEGQARGAGQGGGQ